MPTEKDQQITRQNQTSNVRELLKSKGIIGLLSTYEFMVYVELWTDYCLNGPTDTIKTRFKTFDSIISERKKTEELEVDGLLVD